MKTMPCKSLNKYSMSEPLMTILRAFFRWSSSRLPALLREDNSKCRCPETVAAALRDMPSTYQPSDVRFWHMENRGIGQQLQCGKQKLERKDWRNLLRRLIKEYYSRFLDPQVPTVSVPTLIRWERRSRSRRVFTPWARDRRVRQVEKFVEIKLQNNYLWTATGYSSGSATSRASNVSSSSSNAVDNKHHHNHNCNTNGCLGAIPRNPSYNSMHFRGRNSHSFRVRKQFLSVQQSFNDRNILFTE